MVYCMQYLILYLNYFSPMLLNEQERELLLSILRFNEEELDGTTKVIINQIINKLENYEKYL